MSDIKNYILTCKELEKAYDFLRDEYSSVNCKFFLRDDFLLDDAKEVVKEAYIAESEEKILIMGAKSYNIYAQNSLLKILEEPPRNISFILVSQSKNVFLPTIRSRLLSKEIKVEKTTPDISLNLKNLVIGDIYNFVKENSKLNKNELKELVEGIVSKAILEYRLNFTTKELEYFEELLQLCELNTRANNILISLLLAIMKRARNEGI